MYRLNTYHHKTYVTFKMYKLLKSFVYKGFSLICYTYRLYWLLSDTEMGKDMSVNRSITLALSQVLSMLTISWDISFPISVSESNPSLPVLTLGS